MIDPEMGGGDPLHIPQYDALTQRESAPVMSETDLKRSLLDDELFWKEVVDGLSDEQQGRLLAFVESLKAEGQNG